MTKLVSILAIYGCLVVGHLTSTFVAAETWTGIQEVVNEINSIKCQDGLSLNFSNAYITRIGANFIDSPAVKCVNIADNHLEIIENNSFTSLSNLLYLNISRNNIQNNDLLSFGAHGSLRILSSDYVSHSYNYGINLYVREFFPELRYLSLRGNSISTISYVNKTIALYEDSPEFYTDSVLDALPKIIYMDLSENSLRTVNLSYHETLKYLYLQNNQLPSINLQGLSNLLILNVDANQLSCVTYDSTHACISLKGLKRLKQLSMADNEMRSISSDAFSDTRELISLNLTNNQLGYIQPAVLNPLRSLEDLILDNNQLEDIPDIPWQTNIRVLSLYKNKIKSIPSKIFINSSLLKNLNLGENLIEHVNVEAFYNLQHLEYLNLASNKLTSLPENWCTSLTNLKFLDLSENFFTSLKSLSLINVLPLQQLNLYNHKLKYIHAPFVFNLPENVTINLS